MRDPAGEQDQSALSGLYPVILISDAICGPGLPMHQGVRVLEFQHPRPLGYPVIVAARNAAIWVYVFEHKVTLAVPVDP